MTQVPIIGTDTYEIRRVEHTRLRRRLLEGTWEEDLHNRLQIHLGTVRKAAWGLPDMSSNVFRQIARSLASLYIQPPDVSHPTRNLAAAGIVDMVARSGLWATMNRFQQLTIGCREYWQRVHVSSDGRLTFRPVAPDMTIAKSFADRPDYPVSVREMRERTDAEGKPRWTWDVLDISDPENPVYEVRAYVDGGKVGEDLSAVYLGGSYSGAAYPYRRNDGRPILPYVLYHAERIGDRLFDCYEGIEVVEGSLNIAVSYSMLFHAIKDSSWPQRYIIGAEPQGGTIEGGVAGVRREVVSDPATVLMLRASDEQQPVIGQWQAGCDVTQLENTISAFANRLAQDAGVSPADIQRMGGTARSGYAIALSNEGKRDAQRVYAQSFRASDELLVMTAAILANRAMGSQFPEGGYSVQYRSIPLSGAELDGRRKHALELLDAGLMTRIDALRLFDDALTEQDAVAMLAEIDALNKATEVASEATEMEAEEPEAAPGDVAEDVAESEEEAAPTVVAGEGESIAAAAAAAGQPASSVALNGAQVQAAQGIITSVAKGELPRATGVEMLVQFFNMDAASAETLMGTVGGSFVIAAQEPPGAGS
jgi:hypothetical protein